MSTLESAGVSGEAQRGPREVLLTFAVGQAVVLSADRLDGVTLRLQSRAAEPIMARLHVRPAAHLRDFGPNLDGVEAAVAEGVDDGVLQASVPPGESDVVFRADQPLMAQPLHPVVLLLEPHPAVAWCLSSEEPPGTQAARWDPELGYWRWMHGTLQFTVTPESRPYGAANVLSGVTRPEVGANLWISDPAQPLPQWVELEWPAAVTLERVELTFDSQLSGWIWEGAFPLIARDYVVETRADEGGAWTRVAQVTGNYQRRRVHHFEPRAVRALRVTVLATNGGRGVRLVEVRAYAPAGS